eukprot:1773745-Prorocentrum_lima.AAC.1
MQVWDQRCDEIEELHKRQNEKLKAAGLTTISEPDIQQLDVVGPYREAILKKRKEDASAPAETMRLAIEDNPKQTRLGELDPDAEEEAIGASS